MLTLVTPPAEAPVTLAEARAHCKADTADDTMLQVYLDAAVAHVDGAEGVLGRCLVTQTWDWTLDAFSGVLSVPLPTLQDVVSITYRDADGATQTLAEADYMVSGQTITCPDGWPGTDGYAGAVTVRFTAGYGDAADVPATAKALILLLTEDFYRSRGATDAEAFAENPAVARLIRSIKRWRV